jgi:hypothetical protein
MRAAAALALVLAATACGGSTAAAPGTSGSPGAPDGASAPDWDAQEQANRTKAEDDARRLLALAEIPPGSVELTSAPAALPGPPLGASEVTTAVSLTKHWRVPLSFQALEGYLAKHPPAGLSQGGSSSGQAPVKTRGYAWHAGTSGPAGELQIGIASIGASSTGTASYLRVDARTEWVDPRPIADTEDGPRMRIDAGDPCPPESRGIVGIRNEGDDLERYLAPAEKPKAGLLCSYAGLNDPKPLALSDQRALSAADAARLAEAVHRVDLSHIDGTRSCPGGGSGPRLLMLEYPSRPAVNLWLRLGGCPVASNGFISAVDLPSLNILRRLVDQLDG